MLLVRNLKQLATPRGRGGVRGRAMRELEVIDDAVLVIDGERFA